MEKRRADILAARRYIASGFVIFTTKKTLKFFVRELIIINLVI